MPPITPITTTTTTHIPIMMPVGSPSSPPSAPVPASSILLGDTAAPGAGVSVGCGSEVSSAGAAKSCEQGRRCIEIIISVLVRREP